MVSKEMKKHLLHSETRKDGVFDFIVNFLCKLPHFDQGAADQGNYRVEDFLERTSSVSGRADWRPGADLRRGAE